jgi:hypothetical protein
VVATVSVVVLESQGSEVIDNPLVIHTRCTRPHRAGVMLMSRAIQTVVVAAMRSVYGGEYLTCFKHHLYDVFIAHHTGGGVRVSVENEYVHNVTTP